MTNYKKSINILYIINKVYQSKSINRSLKSLENQTMDIDNIYILDYCGNEINLNDFEIPFLKKITIERKSNDNNIIMDIKKYVHNNKYDYYYFTTFDCCFPCDYFRVIMNYNSDFVVTDSYFIENGEAKYYPLSPIINFINEETKFDYYFFNNIIFYKNIQSFLNKLVCYDCLINANNNNYVDFVYSLWKNAKNIKIDNHTFFESSTKCIERGNDYCKDLKLDEYIKMIITLYREKIEEGCLTETIITPLLVAMIEKYSLSTEYIEKHFFVKINEKFNVKDLDYFYSLKNTFHNGFETYEQTKKHMMKSNIDFVSFDIFDTLIKRKCLEPTDMFYELDKKFNEYYPENQYIYFSSIRIEAENQCRKNCSEKKAIEEVTIDEIYDYIKQNYSEINRKLVDEIKEYEKQKEIEYCICRNSGKELFELAQYLNKKVIIISDMYLDIKTITKILEKNGYKNIYKIFLSSVTKKLKCSGKAYEYVLNDLDISADKIMHIGDNINSDVEVPKKYDIKSFELKKINSFLYESNWYNNYKNNKKDSMFLTADSLNFYGNKGLLALVANTLYDYPFLNQGNTEYYSCPSVIGQIPLFLSLYSTAIQINEIKVNKKYKKLLFVSRDGYMLQRAYNEVYKNEITNTDYLYCSRKVFLPLSIKDRLDYYSLTHSRQNIPLSPEKFYKYFKDHISMGEKEYKNLIIKNGYSYINNFSTEKETNEFIKFYLENIYNAKLHQSNRKNAKLYFEQIINDDCCLIDVGYSGRGETILSLLLGKKINSIYIHSKDIIPYNRSNKIGFNIYTILPSMPKISGSIREQLLSKCDGSCIRIDYENNKTEKAKYKSFYPEEWTINTIQNQAINMIKTFELEYKGMFSRLDFKTYDLNLFLEKFYYFPYINDAKIFKSIYFEDDINISKKIVNLFDIWIQFIRQYYPLESENKREIPIIVEEPTYKRSFIKKAIVKILKPVYQKAMIRISKVVEMSVVNAMQDNTNSIAEIKNNIKK